jgi:NAD(P)-dependent dehydrogenase (short-subunit alcohol dehydrogenase family)
MCAASQDEREDELAEVRFNGRAILVTGGGRGIGRCHCLLLASRGAQVVVADNGSAMDGEGTSAGPAETVAAEIEAAGGRAVACMADLSTEAGANEAVARTVEAFGRIDGVLHNASTVPELRTTDLLNSHDLEVVMRINTFAGLWLSRAAWPHMQRQKFGRILFTTSVGIYGQEGTAPYSAAKAAALGIMRALAVEGARDGIHVNAIAPSARTRMTEKFLASAYAKWLFDTMPPEKISVAAAFLMSEACDLNGEVVALGGGRLARLTFAETEGVIRSGSSIEEVRDAMPEVMADSRWFYPKDLAVRSAKVAAMFGFKG